MGEPPHDGKTSQAIIAKVLTDRPRSIRLARDTVPVHVEAAVDRALAKLPADRYHTAREFADALAGKGMHAVPARMTSEPPPGASARSPSRARAAIPWTIAVVAVMAAAAGWARASRPEERPAVLRYELPLPSTTTLVLGSNNPVAISRDGRFIAYCAQSAGKRPRLYLRAADELQPREVPGSEDATFPFFSPDGQWVAFLVGSQILKAPVSGGEATVLGELPARRGILEGASWSPGGWVVTSDGIKLVKIPAAGGPPQAFTTPDATQETAQRNPVALADGKTVLYASVTMGGPARARIGIASLDDGTSRVLDVSGSFPLGVLEGHLVYATAAGTLMAVPFDVAAARVTGPPIALADQSAVDGISTTTAAQLSADGSLTYVSGVTRRQMTLFGPDGLVRPLGDAGAYTWPRLSPDGKRVALSVGSLTRRDVYVYDLPGGPLTRITNEGTINDRPEWTPDGKALLFRSDRRAPNALWMQPTDGGSQASLLYRATGAQIDEGVLSPDGNVLLVQRDSTGDGAVWFRAMRGDTTPRLVEAGSGAFGARFSPDGKWWSTRRPNPAAIMCTCVRSPRWRRACKWTPTGGRRPCGRPTARASTTPTTDSCWRPR